MTSPESLERLERARLALEGLSLGDAFGQRFFAAPERIAGRSLPQERIWRFTDDTVMALSVFETLAEHGRIDQDALAERFASRYRSDPGRGYGAGMHRLLACVGAGASWRAEAAALFGGSGSFGNGSAMRVAPVGAYFADDLERAADEARESSQVTHSHPEGVAGAIAVAVASAVAWRMKTDARLSLLDETLAHVPEGLTRDVVLAARELPPDTPVPRAAARLGNGSAISAPDTVGYCLWCAERHLSDYEEALWSTVSGLGDMDTTCAIVGGIVAMHGSPDDLPGHWLERREPLGIG